MNTTKGKISTRQGFLIVFLALASPALRIWPNYMAEISGTASILIPVISLALLISYILALFALFNKNPNASYYDILKKSFGTVVAKILTVIYLLWAILLLAIYLRYFAERFLNSILKDAPMEFLFIVLLTLVFLVAKNGIEAFARTSEFLLIIFITLFFLVFALSAPEIKLTNLYPVTTYDIIPLIKCLPESLGLAGYFLLIFFFGDKVSHKENIKKDGIRFTIYLTITLTILLINTIGILGTSIAEKFPFPYFTMIKNISILGTVERIESIFIATWLITDFVIITLFTYVIIHLFRDIFALKSTRSTLLPILLFTYMSAFFIANNAFELNKFSKNILDIVNFSVFIILPLIVLAVGKMRKRI